LTESKGYVVIGVLSREDMMLGEIK